MQIRQVYESFRKLDTVLFESETVRVLFSPPTLQLFYVSPRAANVIRAVQSGVEFEACAQQHSISLGALEQLLTSLLKGIGSAPPILSPPRSREGPLPMGPSLPKFVLMVNNYCNLKCTYCYEHSTVFTKKAIDMPIPVARKALDEFFSTFHSIGELMFIGGEPTLSDDVVAFACDYAKELSLRADREPPTFSMITNGARLTDRMFSLMEQHRIQVTFSLDGPREVNDLVRIRHDGSGSYDDVHANIGRYRQVMGDLLGVECTLTAAHREASLTVTDLMEFFAREFGVEQAHIAAAGLVSNSPLSLYPSNGGERLQREYEDAAARSVDHLLAQLKGDSGARGSLDIVSSMLRRLMKRRSTRDMCPAGTSQLVVDAFGDVYPCWMFAGMENFRMGNIMEDAIFNEKSKQVLSRIFKNNKDANPQCSVCYARYLCSACVGNNQNSTGTMERIDERFCDTVRASVKAVLLKVGEIQQNRPLWESLRGQAAKHRGRQAPACDAMSAE